MNKGRNEKRERQKEGRRAERKRLFLSCVWKNKLPTLIKCIGFRITIPKF